MASSRINTMAASLQSTKFSTCSECGLGLNGLGLKLKCMHSTCLQCLQNIFNDDQLIKCRLCQEDPNKASTSKQGISSEHSVLDASNVADHILIAENFVVKLTTKNHSRNDEYDKGVKITCNLIPVGVSWAPHRELRPLRRENPGATTTSGDRKHSINVEDHHDGTYDLSGRCVDGKWELQCYVNDMQIRQSPLKINVVKSGLQELPNIFREKRNIYMFDIVDDTVYACGGINEITKFTLTGELICTIYGPKSSKFTSLCCVNVKGELSIVCYDAYMKTLMIYKHNWSECKGIKIGSVLGKMTSHDDEIYVPDYGNDCVLCISMEGKLLQKIESRNYKHAKISRPYGVAVTQKGNVLVLSYGDSQLVMFDKDLKADVLIENGTTYGKLYYPYAIVVDERDQIIIGSWKKLQLFNKDGKFIKNIDMVEKNLPESPYSIYSKNRRLWVADKHDSSLRLYNY